MDRKGSNNIEKNSSNISSRGSRNLGRLIMHLRRLERQPYFFEELGYLTPSELHTIEAIGFENAILMSELALRLGVTKGAVSQIVKRMETKGLVNRSTNPEDSRGSLVSNTEKGKHAFQEHQKIHSDFYNSLRAEFKEDEIEIFERIIEKLNEYFSLKKLQS